MRYLDALDKAEEEALRKRTEALQQQEGYNPRPAVDPSPEYLKAAAMSAGVWPANAELAAQIASQSTDRADASGSKCAPSPNGESADKETSHNPEPKRRTQSPERMRPVARPVAGAADYDHEASSIGAFSMENRMGWLDCAAVIARADKAARDKGLSPPHDRRRPSSNGEKTATDERG